MAEDRRVAAWDLYWSTVEGQLGSGPSGFVRWALPKLREAPGTDVVEIGAGAGRDVRFLVENGYRVRYVTAAALVNELVEASDDRSLSRVVGRYGRYELLCLDELGYIELDRRGAELLFQVFTEREEKASIAIASNAAFSEWTSAFTDPRLCAAIVDRLTYDGHIITTGTSSYRLRATTARRHGPGGTPSPEGKD